MTNELIGAIFAGMGSDTQAEFFNGLGRMARLSWKSAGGTSDISAQCFHILKDLDPDGKKIIRELAAMVGSEEEEARKRQEETIRIISEAERKLEAVRRVASSWTYQDGDKDTCAEAILRTLESKP